MQKISILVLGLLLAACHRGPSNEQLAKEKLEKMKHYSEIMLWRNERVDKLKTPSGWLSLVGMHWLPSKGVTRIGSGPANGTRLSVGPASLGLISISDGMAWFQPESGVPITINDLPSNGRVRLVPDTEGAPTVVGFNDGQASFIVIQRGGKLALRVRDANAKTRREFTGIDYFKVDKSFQLDAQFKAHDAGRTIDIVNILGMVEPMMNPGTLTFNKDGKSYTLEALDEGDHRLFVVFADRTSGHETYAAARFVYADYPDANGKTILDFNKAYNPPCAFTPYSTCPMPPPSNRLDMLVSAGEKKPRKPAGQ